MATLIILDSGIEQLRNKAAAKWRAPAYEPPVEPRPTILWANLCIQMKTLFFLSVSLGRRKKGDRAEREMDLAPACMDPLVAGPPLKHCIAI